MSQVNLEGFGRTGLGGAFMVRQYAYGYELALACPGLNLDGEDLVVSLRVRTPEPKYLVFPVVSEEIDAVTPTINYVVKEGDFDLVGNYFVQIEVVSPSKNLLSSPFVVVSERSISRP